MDGDGRVLYLVVSGAPAPEGIPALVAACQVAGWRVVVFSTPTGSRFIDPAELEKLTGEPVRSEYRMPGTGASVPPADAVLACPLTFNSVNKFAHGHADNFAVGLLCEMAGYGVPVVMVPHCKPQLASHPAFAASLETLRAMGIRVLFDPGAPYERRLPPWSEVVDALRYQRPGSLPSRCYRSSWQVVLSLVAGRMRRGPGGAKWRNELAGCGWCLANMTRCCAWTGSAGPSGDRRRGWERLVAGGNPGIRRRDRHHAVHAARPARQTR